MLHATRRSRTIVLQFTSLLGLIGCLFIASAAFAATTRQPYTDRVYTNDGGLYIGAIQSLRGGILTLDTGPAGIIAIDWWRVIGVDTATEYQVVADDAQIYNGRLDTVEGSGELTISGSSESHTVSLDEVIRLVLVGGTMLQRVIGSVNLGLSYTQTNANFQYSLGAAADYRSRRQRGSVDLQSLLNRQSDAETTAQSDLTGFLAQRLGRKWNVFELGQLQSNPAQGYDLRAVLGGGMARYLVERSPRLLDVDLGVVFNQEWVADSPSSNSSGEVLLALQYLRSKRSLLSPNISLFIATFTNVTGESRFRVQSSFRIQWKILRHLSYQLDIRDGYDSNPPTEDADKNNLSIISSLAYTF